MFTGLIEATGTVRRLARKPDGVRLEIDAPLAPYVLGESISVSGACLTVVGMSDAAFAADVSLETLERTTLGTLSQGDPVNLERSVTPGTRLGGHLVTGHVDGIAKVVATEPVGDALRVRIEPPSPLLAFIARKGSVALDGVSLTVNEAGSSAFEIMLIPHTMSVTTLKSVTAGRRLNLEVDLVARYVVRYLEATRGTENGPDLGDALRRAGYLDPKS